MVYRTAAPVPKKALGTLCLFRILIEEVDSTRLEVWVTDGQGQGKEPLGIVNVDPNRCCWDWSIKLSVPSVFSVQVDRAVAAHVTKRNPRNP